MGDQIRTRWIALTLAACGLLLAPDLWAEEPRGTHAEVINSLAWLAGCWQGDGGEECWLSPRGGVMIGINRGPERQGKQPVFELLRIVEGEGNVVFLASPGGRYPPVVFPALEVGAERVVFANPEHDFPQRISYWPDDGDMLRARVEARENGDWQGFDVSWQRGSWRGSFAAGGTSAAEINQP